MGRSVRVMSVALLAAAVFAPNALAGPGPRLEEPQAKLDAALKCSPDVDSAQREPVLLVPGTGATPQHDYGWNYLPILKREGYPICTLTYRDHGMIDFQIQVEYVVNAIRRVAQRSGRKIAIIGHSQGAILNSYALRFWPDLARKVEDFVGIAGTYTYGSDLAPAICAAGCPTPFKQAVPGSPFMAAMAHTPLPAGPGYTAYLTRTDELIQPQPKAGTLDAPRARTYILQDLCPTGLYEHNLIVAAAATVALTLDALSHPGPADVKRLPAVPCGLVPEATRGAGEAPGFALGTVTGAAGGTAREQPPLRCHLDPACPKPRLQPVLAARTTRSTVLTTSGTLELPEGALRQCEGRVIVQIKRGRRVIRRSTAALAKGTSPTGPDCQFTTNTRIRRRGPGRMRVIARYGGSDELLPAGAPSQRIRVGGRPRPGAAGR